MITPSLSLSEENSPSSIPISEPFDPVTLNCGSGPAGEVGSMNSNRFPSVSNVAKLPAFGLPGNAACAAVLKRETMALSVFAGFVASRSPSFTPNVTPLRSVTVTSLERPASRSRFQRTGSTTADSGEAAMSVDSLPGLTSSMPTVACRATLGVRVRELDVANAARPAALSASRSRSIVPTTGVNCLEASNV